jgi:hypothetical protein
MTLDHRYTTRSRKFLPRFSFSKSDEGSQSKAFERYKTRFAIVCFFQCLAAFSVAFAMDDPPAPNVTFERPPKAVLSKDLPRTKPRSKFSLAGVSNSAPKALLSSDGKRMAVGYGNYPGKQGTQVWQLSPTPKLISEFPPFSDRLAFSPGGRLLATNSSRGVLDVNTKKLVSYLPDYSHAFLLC